jgi:hypothetical protein
MQNNSPNCLHTRFLIVWYRQIPCGRLSLHRSHEMKLTMDTASANCDILGEANFCKSAFYQCSLLIDIKRFQTLWLRLSTELQKFKENCWAIHLQNSDPKKMTSIYRVRGRSWFSELIESNSWFAKKIFKLSRSAQRRPQDIWPISLQLSKTFSKMTLVMDAKTSLMANKR